MHPEASRLVWDDVERTILEEHRQHRSFAKVERHTRRHLRRHLMGLKAQTITYDRLLTYKRDRLAEGASPSTVRYELSLIRTGLVVAQRAGRLLALPLIPPVHVENTRTSFFEHDEFDRLVRELEEPVAAVASFMYWTGWRRNETLSREWRHVDFERGVIVLEPGETKSGEGRTFPFDVLPRLAELLRKQREYTNEVERRTGQKCPWVFHRDGKQIASIRHAWRGACKRAVAMKLVGHQTEAIYRRYAITSEADLREGLSRVVNQR